MPGQISSINSNRAIPVPLPREKRYPGRFGLMQHNRSLSFAADPLFQRGTMPGGMRRIQGLVRSEDAKKDERDKYDVYRPVESVQKTADYARQERPPDYSGLDSDDDSILNGNVDSPRGDDKHSPQPIGQPEEYEKGKKQETFDYLGLTYYISWARKKGRTGIKTKTSRKRVKTKLIKVKQWVRTNRHKMKLKELWDQFRVKMLGHIRYYE